MELSHRHLIGAAAIIAAPFFATAAHAQLSMDAVKGQLGGGAAEQSGSSAGSAAQGLGGALGGGDSSALSALGGGSVSAGSAGNAAGVLEFCMKNNYLSGGDASSVKDQLMGKLGGSEKASSDESYTKGAEGILTGGNGQSVDLSGGGLKEEITRKACDQVLEQGKSFL
ncbi:DUF2501 domain-containing protein [Bordetella tumulicola]|uniref:DUF2501 domain-containing protein n=1 Tax=Bordetella tumulicola TaxID=1649133 RepID=UPI0039EFDCC5